MDNEEEVFTSIPERTNCRVYELDEEEILDNDDIDTIKNEYSKDDELEQ